MAQKRKHYAEPLRRDPLYFKARNFKDYLTVKEVAIFVSRDPSAIRRREREGKIPKAARVKRGQLEIRMFSPTQAQEIKEYFEKQKAGRPKKEKEDR
jgi:hypothetical protein